MGLKLTRKKTPKQRFDEIIGMMRGHDDGVESARVGFKYLNSRCPGLFLPRCIRFLGGSRFQFNGMNQNAERFAEFLDFSLIRI
jgi:hypothetical protein